ncbi:LysE family translocator [Mesorhizobium xinjiangense]|uniref:LysE family translocator n=1 Tax=Mesorhizobium xinjiangense TaxID=2678685 RepID=UPI0012ED8071|nr:LysE family translocator [Mesorhizobium xinjiangense]
MSPDIFLAYLLACTIVVLVPGPTVTLIIASSMRHGTRAGLLNVAGTQAGMALMIAIVGIGLNQAIALMGHWFEVLRWLGAAYLIYLGWQMIRSGGMTAPGAPPRTPHGGFVLQGFLVAMSNPKTLVFFGAFIPQFIDPGRDYAPQILIMGATALAVAAMSDSVYAVAAGRAGRALSTRRIRLLARISGSFLIGGGLWLAFSRAR